jgi:SAM-dependent methyltransferase
MRSLGQGHDMDQWLVVVRSKFVDVASDLLPLLDTYAAEAKFGRSFIDADLKGLGPTAKVLEVGAGSFLLACQLVREGFNVTALEPTSEGFSHFDRMRQIVLNIAQADYCCPNVLDIPAENLTLVNCFDYAFSVNVMEHVSDVTLVLEAVGRSLCVGASYRFTCPNYFFPYEPHFNIPTVFSKKLTERLLGRRIFESQRVPDPVGTWQSLNWINVTQIETSVQDLEMLRVTFNRTMLVTMLGRIASDPVFAARRSPVMRRFLAGMIRLKLHYILGLVPALLQPVIDCNIQKFSA